MTDPYFNIETGSKLLGHLYIKYGKDTVKTLCAYWAGESKCDEWTESVERDGSVFNVQSIPDANTQRFVKEVRDGYEFYQPYYQD